MARPTQMPPKPTADQLRAANDTTIPDLISRNLRVLFCGINPGLYSGATRHHFARPGNRFWPALFAAGFTPRLLRPWEERELLAHRLGITNVVARTTASAAELTLDDYRNGIELLRKKILKYQPRVLAVLGVTAYRAAFEKKDVALGLQPDRIGTTAVWILPNPSGLNAHYTPANFGKLFRELREFAA